jgi:hypothetical protein
MTISIEVGKTSHLPPELYFIPITTYDKRML